MPFVHALALLSFLMGTMPPQAGRIHGTVVCEGTSEPVPGVRISAGGLRTVTDGDGHFTLDNAPVGSTSVRAQRNGYFGPAVNGEFTNVAVVPVVIKPSEPATIKIVLVRAGGISGKIFDSSGSPLYDSVVGGLRIVYKNGARTVEVVGAKPSGRSGEYRLYPLPPGEYYVGVAPSTNSELTTLYPGTMSLNAASRILVGSAQEIVGIDIHTQAGK